MFFPSAQMWIKSNTHLRAFSPLCLRRNFCCPAASTDNSPQLALVNMASILHLTRAVVRAVLTLTSSGTVASTPLYKSPKAPVEARVADLLSIEDTLEQIIQGDTPNWMNQETGVFNASGLEANMVYKWGAFYTGSGVAYWRNGGSDCPRSSCIGCKQLVRFCGWPCSKIEARKS